MKRTISPPRSLLYGVVLHRINPLYSGHCHPSSHLTRMRSSSVRRRVDGIRPPIVEDGTWDLEEDGGFKEDEGLKHKEANGEK